MAQFDVHATPDGLLVVDVQADALGIRDTRVVVPLVLPDGDAAPVRGLTPLLTIAGDERLLATHLIAVVDRRALSTSHASLVAERLTIQAALDLLFNGH